MSTLAYAKRHRELGLCRNCQKPLIEGSALFCKYHLEKERIGARRRAKTAIVRLKAECLEQYGKKCACCDEGLIQFLTIDYEGGFGNLHRKKLFGYNVGGLKYTDG